MGCQQPLSLYHYNTQVFFLWQWQETVLFHFLARGFIMFRQRFSPIKLRHSYYRAQLMLHPVTCSVCSDWKQMQNSETKSFCVLNLRFYPLIIGWEFNSHVELRFSVVLLRKAAHMRQFIQILLPPQEKSTETNHWLYWELSCKQK